jgi:hypothetical protein
MNRLFAWRLCILPIFSAFALALAPGRLPGQEIVRYVIAPGSLYTYKPSPWVGIPGGQPSPFRLDFGVSGNLVVAYDGYWSQILSAGIQFSGNEAIQNNPPSPDTPVTAALVADFLESMFFQEVQITSQYTEYAPDPPSGPILRDYVNGNMTLTGGFDGTVFDGIAMLFNITATPLEPGDYNGDGTVDGADLIVWQENYGTSNPFVDGNGDGIVDTADYIVWRLHQSPTGAGSTTIPEPTTAALLLIAALMSLRKMKAP